MMPDTSTRNAHASLVQAVMEVAALDKRTRVSGGAGRLVWQIGLPLLAVVLVQVFLPLPFYLRLPVLPLAFWALIWKGWKQVFGPLLAQYSATSAAMMVESEKPDFESRLVTSIEIYDDTERETPHFNPGMTHALIRSTWELVRKQNLREVIDLVPSRRNLSAALVVVIGWVGIFAFNAKGMSDSLFSMVSAWSEARDQAQKLAGATITIEPLDRRAYLRGSNLTIRAVQQGFHKSEMTVFLRPSESEEWNQTKLEVDATGRAQLALQNVEETFECYFKSGVIESGRLTVPVTVPPRVVKMTVEYQFPEYVRRASIVQDRSDGNLSALWGSTIIIQLEANKTLSKAALKGSFIKNETELAVGGRFARVLLRLDRPEWLADQRDLIEETYQLKLVGEYGYPNEDRDHKYSLTITKDKPPTLSFKRLPHRSPAHEPHIVVSNLSSVPISIAAKDDYGIVKLNLRYRLESLETGIERANQSKTIQFAVPRTEIPILSLMRLSEIGATVGDRIVFWAEAFDGYDLEPEKGPHIARTPVYKVAVVTEEDLFNEVVYKDTWETQWYDGLKMAQRSRRQADIRRAPDPEPEGKVTIKLLERSQVPVSFSGLDELVIQDYFNSLNVQE
ncbi:MAG: hypothetical protein O3B01_24280 [Planctomycetota bacterium]|nr:hypothetical protein [Planctomycetota bacterium]